MANDVGRSADADGLSQAEPKVSALRASIPSACRNCGGGEWVCENHVDRPWDGTSARDDACGCGAGAPCPVCCSEMAFAGRRAATIQACAEIALSAFDWRFGEAPRTYRALANRIGEEIRRLQYASAIEAGTAETAKTGSVHESAGPKDDAQPSKRAEASNG